MEALRAWKTCAIVQVEEPLRNLAFTQQLIKEGNAIVAYCPELDVSSCGATPEQARDNLRTAARLFIEEAAKLGTLADILAEAGYELLPQC